MELDTDSSAAEEAEDRLSIAKIMDFAGQLSLTYGEEEPSFFRRGHVEPDADHPVIPVPAYYSFQ